tara:strand:+ start:459 stop:1493 length:1035 start_codon:yes stop_codon:yes gene_type:complete
MSEDFLKKELTAKILLEKIKKEFKFPSRRKKYLINCLNKQGFIKKETEKLQTEPIFEHDSLVCKICNSSDFLKMSNSNVCNNCGDTTLDLRNNPFITYKQELNLDRGTFIEPGSEFISIIKDGRNVKRDLSKVNFWTNLDPEEERIKKEIQNIQETIDGLDIKITDTLNRIIITMWINIITNSNNLKGKVKKALIIWCIYYPLAYNKIPINLQRLTTILEITIGELYSYNFLMKTFFKDTSYYKYITITTGENLDIEIDKEMEEKIKIVQKDLKDYLSNPNKKKELIGIIYFLSNKLYNKKYKLIFLSEKSGISPNIISAESGKIETFYKKNRNLEEKLKRKFF